MVSALLAVPGRGLRRRFPPSAATTTGARAPPSALPPPAACAAGCRALARGGAGGARPGRDYALALWVAAGRSSGRGRDGACIRRDSFAASTHRCLMTYDRPQDVSCSIHPTPNQTDGGSQHGPAGAALLCRRDPPPAQRQQQQQHAAAAAFASAPGRACSGCGSTQRCDTECERVQGSHRVICTPGTDQANTITQAHRPTKQTQQTGLTSQVSPATPTPKGAGIRTPTSAERVGYQYVACRKDITGLHQLLIHK